MLAKKVLVIDDESSLRRSLGISLLQQGYESEPCENGLKALSKLNLYLNKDIPLDYVLLDIKLPDIDGLKLSQIIKYKYPEMPVILMTGYADTIDQEEINNTKIDGFFKKPFPVEDLVKQFNLIEDRKQYITTAPDKETYTEPKTNREVKTFSSYLLIKLEENLDYYKIYKELYFMDNVLYCDATNGDYDIVLLIQGNNIAECKEIYMNKIKKIKGIKEVEYLRIDQPILEDNISDMLCDAEKALFKVDSGFVKDRNVRKHISSYVLLQIEKEKLSSIYPTLFLNENVISCDYTMGKYNIILLMQGYNFGEIDKIIERKIRKIDGILKIKEIPIINIYESNF